MVPQSDGRGVRARTTSDRSGDPHGVRGAWTRLERGYRVTLGMTWPEWQRAHVGGRVRFDLLVNEMLPGRQRRAGPLVWSGGKGWGGVRGERQGGGPGGVVEAGGWRLWGKCRVGGAVVRRAV